jgi:3D (Asp-Asp-Asp) domain-containing protein
MVPDNYKPAPRGCAKNVVSPVILSLNVLCLVIVTGTTTRRGGRRKRRDTTRRRAAMPTCVGNGTPTRAPPTPPPTRMPPTSSSTKASSSPTSATNASWQRMAKRRRYNLEPPPSILHLVMRVVLVMMKMSFSLFLPTLTCKQEKLNELIGVIHEKDELLDSQEKFLIKENKKHVKVKNAYAQEVEKNGNLSKELSMCHKSISNLRPENANLIAKVEKLNACNDSISNLRNENSSIIAKIDELNDCKKSISCLRSENATLHDKIEELNICKPSTSILDHVTVCTRCRDVNVDAINDHLALIKQQNDHIAQLTAKINEHEIENEKFKFARSILYSGIRPDIKDGIGFQQGSNVKLNAPKRLSNFVKDKTPMVQNNEGYILYPANYTKHKIRRIHAKKSHSVSHHAFMYKNEASSSRHSTHVKMPKKKTPTASNEPNISFKTFDASYVLTNKSGKIVAKYVGGKHKGSKTCVWVPKVLVSNVKGPKTVWVPKNKA